MKKVNRARKAANLKRAHGSADHRAWMKRQPCVVCGRTPSDAAHLKSGGTGRKDDWQHTVPMCSTIVEAGYSGHHDEYDDGKQSFRAKYAHLDLEQLAVETHERFEREAA